MARPTEVCEMCAREVAPEDAYHAELSVGDMMCPTPMTFHRACYEQAKDVWEPAAPDSVCVVDSEFPETQGWPTGRPS